MKAIVAILIGLSFVLSGASLAKDVSGQCQLEKIVKELNATCKKQKYSAQRCQEFKSAADKAIIESAAKCGPCDGWNGSYSKAIRIFESGTGIYCAKC